jgi:hypothetical protein
LNPKTAIGFGRISQIDTKEYLTPWRGTGKTLVKVGVSFDTKKT